MAEEKRRPRLWLAIAVAALAAVAIWMIVAEFVWRDPDLGDGTPDGLIQPATVPPSAPAGPATPDNSGRDATGNAVARDDGAAERRP